MISPHRQLELLLLQEATGRLSAAEQAELNELLRQHPDIDRYAYARTAAKVFLAAAATSTRAMPGDLYAKIVADGERLIEEADSGN